MATQLIYNTKLPEDCSLWTIAHLSRRSLLFFHGIQYFKEKLFNPFLGLQWVQKFQQAN